MYKRKVHVLYFSLTDGSAEIAAAYTHAFGGAWIEPCAVGLSVTAPVCWTRDVMAEDGIELLADKTQMLTPELLRWSDLLVTLGYDANEASPVLPSHVQKKYWPIPDIVQTSGNGEDIIAVYRPLRDEIKLRVQSLVGGVRMIAK